ncbi:MAG TPA: acetyl-CoA carboxylase biotin carboxyl carrier protein [Gemmatimonadales bacterium]|nr:acetyl-CoA carboxylase biotin carboxyl carrier protein [Gemmatimonadales bacterium]
MKPDEMAQLAELLGRMPGIKAIELKDVKRLTDLLRESPEIGSIEVKGFFGTGIVITRTAQGVGAAASLPAPAALYAPAAQAAPAAAPPPAPAPAPSNLKEVKSPMVGTFYSAPEPGAEAYARVGARVSSGQTVCIIEAMKIMNEIESEFSGVIREVCVEDAQPVEFGQVLFRVDPNG